MKWFKGIVNRLERMMMAAAFAEADCADTALDILKAAERPRKRPVSRTRVSSSEQRPVMRV